MAHDGSALQPLWNSTVTANRCVISLWERPPSTDMRRVAVSVDSHQVGELNLNPWETLSVGVGQTHVVIWVSTHLYVIRRDTHSLTLFRQDEPVKEVYPINHHWWCLVRELSVVLADLDRQIIEEVFDLSEVIVASWWEGNRLYVEDFQQRRFAFELSTGNPTLTRVDIAVDE